jgi:hypothetical protein
VLLEIKTLSKLSGVFAVKHQSGVDDRTPDRSQNRVKYLPNPGAGLENIIITITFIKGELQDAVKRGYRKSAEKLESDLGQP